MRSNAAVAPSGGAGAEPANATAVVPSAESGAEPPKEEKERSCIAYFGYYFLWFWSEWFGAKAFDMDGDGDFDVDDVEVFIAKWTGKVVQRSGSLTKVVPVTPAPGSGLEKVQNAILETNETLVQSIEKAKDDLEDKLADTVVGEFVQEQNEKLQEELDKVADKVEDMQDAFQNVAGDKVTDGKAHEDIVLEELIKKRRLPIFMVGQCFVAGMLWLVPACINYSGNIWKTIGGLDSLDPGSFTLRLHTECEDNRFQIWRWFLYQFTHTGLSHIGMNCLLNCILGIPIEAVNGHKRMIVMFNVGVLGGACAFSVSDAHNIVVGMSGGCYSLFGIHYADLMLNWNQKKFRKLTLALLVGLIGIDFLNYWFSTGGTKSHSAHFGGAVAGFFIGLIILKNSLEEKWEKYLRLFAMIGGPMLVLGCVVRTWAIWAPRNIWELEGHCWERLVWKEEFGAEFRCVQCGDDACIQRTSAAYSLRPFSEEYCLNAKWIDMSG